LLALLFFPIDDRVTARAILHAPCKLLVAPGLFQPGEWLAVREWALGRIWIMTFIIEATKDDHHTTDIRSTAIVAVILARKLAADGFAVSITAPSGQLYAADQFNLLLTCKV
jgi:hypothetical protein